MKVAVAPKQHRREGEDDEKKRPAIPGHERAANGELEKLLRDKHDELRAPAGGLEIGDDAADDAAELCLVKVGGGLALQIREKLVAQIVDNTFAQLVLVALAKVRDQRGGNRKGEETKRAKQDAAVVPAGDGAVDHGGERPKKQGALKSADECADENNAPLRRVGV